MGLVNIIVMPNLTTDSLYNDIKLCSSSFQKLGVGHSANENLETIASKSFSLLRCTEQDGDIKFAAFRMSKQAIEDSASNVA